MCRASGKECDWRTQAAYAKGDAVIYFDHWLIRERYDKLVLNTVRAIKGGRQDVEIDAAIELWWNLTTLCEFLVSRSAQEKERSKLRDCLATQGGSIEVRGALMARLQSMRRAARRRCRTTSLAASI